MELNRRAFTAASVAAAGGLAMSAASPRALAAADRSEFQAQGADAIYALVDYCLATTYESLPQAVVEATRNQILDTVGVALAGIKESGVNELRELGLELGGRPEAVIWGSRQRLPAHDAARINATMAHALDYDDIYEKSFMHPGVVNVPAALATADLLGGRVSGKQVIAAVALGVDISCRLANSAQPGVNGFKVGWHNTTLYGYFASALVAGKLMGLTRAQMVAAAGIAYHQAAGNAQAHVDGALTKRMGPGFACYTGLYAARLAQRGVPGARGVLEGVRGFFHQYHGNHYARGLLLDGLGHDFAAPDVAFKPWPSCRGSHTAVEAALTLFKAQRIDADEVEKITIHTGPDDFQLLGTPLAKKRQPTSTVEAQFSNPWVVAVALQDKEVALRHFTPAALGRPDLLAITRRITTAADPGLAKPGGGPSAARIEVQLKSGRSASQLVTTARGEPNNPMSRVEFLQKFMDCAVSGGMQKASASSLLEQILQLQTLASMSGFTEQLSV